MFSLYYYYYHYYYVYTNYSLRSSTNPRHPSCKASSINYVLSTEHITSNYTDSSVPLAPNPGPKIAPDPACILLLLPRYCYDYVVGIMRRFGQQPPASSVAFTTIAISSPPFGGLFKRMVGYSSTQPSLLTPSFNPHPQGGDTPNIPASSSWCKAR